MHVKVEAGAEFDTVTPSELEARFGSFERKLAQQGLGIKHRRLPRMVGTVQAGGLLTIGGDNPNVQTSNVQVGPSEGNFWMIRHLAVNGLATGATPDIVNLAILGAAPPADFWWQFNGNNFAYTFGSFELWLNGGEYLAFTNQGALAAPVGTAIRVVGSLLQIPQELAYRLLGGGT